MITDIETLGEVLEGVFYVESGNLFVPGNEKPVSEMLEPFLGHAVLIVLHHQPPSVFDVEHWGAGCCMWESTGHCPYGHHDEPQKLFSANYEGQLKKVGHEWFVGQTKLDLTPLEGHISRLVITFLEPPEALTTSLSDLEPTSFNPEELSLRLENLSSLASSLTSIINGIKLDGDDAV